MAPRANTTFELVDKLLKGTLANRLAEWRGDGLSLTACAEEIEKLCGVQTSRETVRRWLLREDVGS
jgi:hypothetical protein